MKLRKSILQKAFDYSKPYIGKVEHYFKPRVVVLSTKPAARLIGIIVAQFALVISFPIPFSNLFPSIALAFIAGGLLQKDGLVVLTSALIGTIYCVFFMWFFISVLQSLFI